MLRSMVLQRQHVRTTGRELTRFEQVFSHLGLGMIADMSHDSEYQPFIQISLDTAKK